MYKALLGPEAAVYGDHVELSEMDRVGKNWVEHGDDFASTIGAGGVVGTKFVWPDPGPKYKAVNLTAEKEQHWKKWIGLYNQKMLSKGDFKDLYVYGYDSPEAYEEFMRSDPQIQSMILHDEPITQHDYNDLDDERESPFEPSTWATSKIKPRYTEKKIVDVIATKDNPRLKILLELVEQCCHKMIIWCRFRRDVDNVCAALGDQCVRYDGSVGRKDREITLSRFKDKDDPVRVFVANVHSISQGVTLTIAKTMIYYSNSFSPEKRLQSEDRFHRIGQDSPVLIIDLVARNTVDVRLIDGLRKKYELSAAVLGDRFREWVQPASEDEEEL